MESAVQALVKECKRQEESCLYTSTALFEWLKDLRRWRTALIVLPIIFAGIAASALLKHWEWVTAIAALLAGIIPAAFKSLDLDKDLAAITRYANTFKALQDRFRQAWRIGSLGDFDAFKKELAGLMTMLD